MPYFWLSSYKRFLHVIDSISICIGVKILLNCIFITIKCHLVEQTRESVFGTINKVQELLLVISCRFAVISDWFYQTEGSRYKMIYKSLLIFRLDEDNILIRNYIKSFVFIFYFIHRSITQNVVILKTFVKNCILSVRYKSPKVHVLLRTNLVTIKCHCLPNFI